MCRHLAYLGPPVTLAALLLDPPHALLHQSWAPHDMRGGGTVNADGFGVGWYAAEPVTAEPATAGPAGAGRAGGPAGPAGGPARWPIRYRRASPMWTDSGFAEFARVTAATAVLAAVRSATVGMPVTEAATAPFAADGRMFSHNGVVAGWPHSVAGLAATLPVVDLLTMEAPTDACFLWALVRHRLRAEPDPAVVLRGVVADVCAAAPGSRLNLLLTDGHRVHATAVGHALSVRRTANAVLVASEPSEPGDGWTAVADHRLLTADLTTYTVEPL